MMWILLISCCLKIITKISAFILCNNTTWLHDGFFALSKEPRKFSPHLVEVDAIQQNSTQIFHKIHYPNSTDDVRHLWVCSDTA